MGGPNSLNPIQLPSVADVVYNELRRNILEGHWRPNQQLNLNRLEEELEVSRTPLKTALARLESEGLVQIHPRRGTFVTQFSREDISECFDLRIALEAEALRNAFEAHNATLCAEIIDLFEAMDRYFADESRWLDELVEYMDLDRIVHIRMVQLSRNKRIQQAYEHANVQGFIAIMGTRFQYSDVQKTMREHGDILAALHQRDLPLLLQAARTHLEGARERAIVRITRENDQ